MTPEAQPRGGRPRIAHVLPFPAVGGTEVAQLRAAHVVIDHGGVNLVLHRPEATSVRDLYRDAGIETAPYRPVELALRAPGRFVREARALARELAGHNIDLLHCADVLAALHVGVAARLAGLPVLCHVRNRCDTLPWRARQLLRPVHQFAFVSHDTWRHFGHRVPRDRGVVLYDGYDPPAHGTDPTARDDVRREFGIPTDAPLVVMVARVAPQKDYPTLIAAAGRVLRRVPEARFVVVGDHSTNPLNRRHFAELAPLLEAHGVRDRFVFTDFRTDVPRFLDAMDVFVLSTHWEGFPLVILEAMAYGRPVVATAVDGVPEIVRDGENGFLVPHEDADVLADRLGRLLSDAPATRRMGDAARRRVQDDFSLAHYGRQLVGVYDGLLARHAPAAPPLAGPARRAHPTPSAPSGSTPSATASRPSTP